MTISFGIVGSFCNWVGNGFAPIEYEDGGYERNPRYARGRGRGKGCNFRGRGRGGYGGSMVATQPDVGGYNQEAPFQGQGRGRESGTRGWGCGFRSNGSIYATAGGS